MPKKTTKRKPLPIPEDKKGTKCSVCGQTFTMPTGYSYPYYSEFSYDNQDHPSVADCVKYLRKELEESKSEVQELKDRIRELERNSRSYDEYH